MGKFLHSVTFEMLTSSKNLPYVQAKSELEKEFCYISAKSCQSKHALLIHERNHFPQIDVWKSPKLLKEAISHKPNDTVKTKKAGFDGNLSQSIVALLIQPSHFFLENGALNAPTPPEGFFLTSPVTHENWHLDVMTTICHNRLMHYWFIHHNLFSENEDLNVSTASEVLFPTSPVTVKSTLYKVFRTNCRNRLMQYWFNHHNLFSENGASKALFPTNPVTREKVLKRTSYWMFWTLKISKKANFVHFVSRPLDENVPKDLFWHK